MEYYESTRPPDDKTAYSGGTGFMFDGVIASIGALGGSSPYTPPRNNPPVPKSEIYTINICVNGVPKLLDVVVTRQPYDL